MSINYLRRALAMTCIAAFLAFAAGHAYAQQWGWGENAAVCGPCTQCNNGQCANGRCCPAQPWGYYQTNWHQWPGAVYPDMVKPAPQNGGELPPAQVDVPSPGKEADIQTPIPGQNSGKGPSYGAPGQGGTSRPSGEGPSDLLPLRESAPSDQPLVIPPNSDGALPGRSGYLPRSRGATAGSVSSSVFDERDARVQSRSRGELKQASTAAMNNARLRAANQGFVRTSSPEQEPDMFVPSLSAKQIPTSSSVDFQNRRTSDARFADSRSQAGNPLRSDWGPEIATPVTLVEAEPPVGENNRSVSGSISTGGFRSNPLRRN